MSFFSLKKFIVLFGLVGLIFVFSFKEAKAFDWEKAFEITGSTRVYCFGVYNNTLYFAANNGKIYSSNGSSFAESVNLGYTFNEQCSFMIYGTKLYFGSINGNGIIKSYDDSNWNNVFTSGYNLALPLGVFNNKLYGIASTLGMPSSFFQYDGSSWITSYGFSAAGEAGFSSAIFNSNIYIGGGMTGSIYKYNGSTFDMVYDSPGIWIYSLAEYKDKLYAADGNSPGNQARIYTSSDGSSGTWSISYDSDGYIDYFHSLAVYNGNLYAVGNETQIKYYDGSAWSSEVDLSTAGLDAFYLQSSIVFNGKLYVGGGGTSGKGVVYSTISPPACDSTDCSSAITNAPCKCGTLTTVAADNGKYCCTGNNAVYNTKSLCQVGACAVIPPPCITGGLVPCGRHCDNPLTTDIDESKPCDPCAAFYMLKRMLNFAMEVAVGIAVFILVIAGLLYAFSAGNPANVEKAKSAITNAIIGLVIMFSAWLIVAAILNAMGYADITTWNQVSCELQK